MRTVHKISISVFIVVVIGFIIISSAFTYILLKNQKENFEKINEDLISFKKDSQIQINELTENILLTNDEIKNINSQVGILKAEKASDFSGIVAIAIESVLTIRTDISQGTGFVITNDGYIITNEHVLIDAEQVWAIDRNQKRIETIFIGSDSTFDIALLKINEDLDPLEFAESVEVGEKVIAIGNPLGLQFSVSEGIVSAVKRQGPNGLNAYIQTDAALNPGNSGGPLIDNQGEVVGINNFKISAENIGFALEAKFIQTTVNKIAQEKLNQTIL